MNKEEVLNTFLLANIPEIITQEEFDDVKKAIKELQQENKQLKEKVQDLKADYGTIAQIERDLYKEVIEEVREFVGSEEMYNCSFEEETNKLLQILDKGESNE